MDMDSAVKYCFCAVRDYAAEGFEIGFNARYLMDILQQIEGDTVEVHLADAAAPTLLRENDKAPALYVLMPMRV